MLRALRATQRMVGRPGQALEVTSAWFFGLWRANPCHIIVSDGKAPLQERAVRHRPNCLVLPRCSFHGFGCPADCVLVFPPVCLLHLCPLPSWTLYFLTKACPILPFACPFWLYTYTGFLFHPLLYRGILRWPVSLVLSSRPIALVEGRRQALTTSFSGSPSYDGNFRSRHTNFAPHQQPALGREVVLTSAVPPVLVTISSSLRCRVCSSGCQPVVGLP